LQINFTQFSVLQSGASRRPGRELSAVEQQQGLRYLRGSYRTGGLTCYGEAGINANNGEYSVY